MLRTIAIALVILLLGLFAWVAFQSSDISIIVNGEKLTGPAKLAAEGWGVLVATVVLFSAAILLVGALVAARLLGLIGLLLVAPMIATLKLFGSYIFRKMFDLDPWQELDARRQIDSRRSSRSL